MSVAEAAVALGMPRSSAYAAVASGAIPCIRFGRHIVVPRAPVEPLLEQDRRASSTR
jgi:excisionase family DNA binding protein